ncbi:hypothetical protein ACP70R_015197 [Stipagrostis hirtigluma subsp. patula]
MAPPPPPELIDDAIAEILLRLPPDDPASLVRASLVCKPWRRTLSDPAFLRRYRALHRAPALLGFLRNRYYGDTRLVATAAASPFSTPALDSDTWCALDCRHGRVLLHSTDSERFIVWDPITGDQHCLPQPAHWCQYLAAAVLCAVDGCGHLDCHGGPFLVVFLGMASIAWASLYTSETREWSAPAYLDYRRVLESTPSRLAGDALYFTVAIGTDILKYDLATRELSVIEMPDEFDWTCMLIATEGGRLGYVEVDKYNLYLSSLQADAEGTEEWVQDRIIDLKTLLPINALAVSPALIGFAEGSDIIFINTDVGAFTIDLNSGQVRKVAGEGGLHLPYISFFTPDLAEARLELS